MLELKCSRPSCRAEIDEPGAILFGPPEWEGMPGPLSRGQHGDPGYQQNDAAPKLHLCNSCYDDVIKFLDADDDD